MRIIGNFRNRVLGLRDRLGPLWWYSGLIFVASRVTDLIMLFVGVIYLPSKLSAADLGSIDPLTRLVGFGGIPLTVFSIVGAKYLSGYHGTRDYGKIKCLLRDMACLAMLSSIVSIVCLYFVFGALSERLELSGTVLYLGITGLVVLSSWQPVLNMTLQGTQRFYASIGCGLVGSIARLVFVLVLVPHFFLTGYLWSAFLAGVASLIVGIFGLRSFLNRRLVIEPYYDEWRGILRYALPVLIYVSVCSLQGFIEPFVIKHRLSALDSGGYYVVCRFALIPSYLVGAIAFVIFPHTSQKHERGESTNRSLVQALMVTVGLGLSGSVLMFFFSDRILSLLPAWRTYIGYAPFMWKIGLIVMIDSLAAIYALHEMACRRFSFVYIMAPIGACYAVLLYAVFGWVFFQPYLPLDLWQNIDQCIKPSLSLAIGLGLAARMFLAGLLGLYHVVSRRKRESCTIDNHHD